MSIDLVWISKSRRCWFGFEANGNKISRLLDVGLEANFEVGLGGAAESMQTGQIIQNRTAQTLLRVAWETPGDILRRTDARGGWLDWSRWPGVELRRGPRAVVINQG